MEGPPPNIEGRANRDDEVFFPPQTTAVLEAFGRLLLGCKKFRGRDERFILFCAIESSERMMQPQNPYMGSGTKTHKMRASSAVRGS